MLTTWLRPFDAVTSATPLGETPLPVTYLQLLTGNHAGSIGETCILALLAGAVYLFWRRAIEWRIPITYLGTVVVLSLLFGLDPLFQLLAGGLILGAFFMATDPVTSPVTKAGRWIFGIGAGIITIVIRTLGGYPEGVCYAILIMNAATPLLDRYTRGRIFGK
jgi:electron transport complex protein RnfD